MSSKIGVAFESSESAPFDKTCTHVIKALAIMLMIIHHLFLRCDEINADSISLIIFSRIAIIGKVCVCLFVMLSGIGLQASVRAGEDIFCTSLQRIASLWIQYVQVVLLSAAVGLILFYDSFIKLVPLTSAGLKSLFMTLTGLQFLFYYPGFNPSWWYISLCILLYAAFPLLHSLLARFGIWLILFLAALSFSDAHKIPHLNITIMTSYVTAFALGMYYMKDGNYKKFNSYLRRNFAALMSLQFALLAAIAIRGSMDSFGIITRKLDVIIGASLIVLIYHYYARLHSKLAVPSAITWLGMNSGNIYFLHVFVTRLYFRDALFLLKYPILIFGAALGLSIMCGIGLSFVQKATNLSKLQDMSSSLISSLYDFFRNQILESMPSRRR